VATATSTNSLTNTVYTLPSGTIPFGFYFNGGVYTGFTISSHGFEMIYQEFYILFRAIGTDVNEIESFRNQVRPLQQTNHKLNLWIQ
jgi:hypothetical protein